jgi:hypothetical protein
VVDLIEEASQVDVYHPRLAGLDEGLLDHPVQHVGNPQWDQIFKDPMTTMAAIDRLVHHSIILEFDGASQRVRTAGDKTPPPAAG